MLPKKPLSLVSITEQLHQRKLRAVDLMQDCLARIQAENPRLNAFSVTRNTEKLLEEAGEADQRLDQGKARPLEGIPCGIKDLEDVKGMVTSFGAVPYADNIASVDSFQVERLKNAGAIIVGKTNTPEFGYTAFTDNPLFGPTRNPWNLEHTPGGSSGGSAAAIAANLVPLATANDGGGSIRLPAAFTGCVGLKPTYGRIARGPSPQWNMLDTSVEGPLTRTVADAAFLLDLTAGAHPLDPNSIDTQIQFLPQLHQIPTRLRIAYSRNLGYAHLQEDILQAFDQTLARFEALGHQVEEIHEAAPNCIRDWIQASAFEILGRLTPVLETRAEQFSRGFLASLESGYRMNPRQWTQIKSRREEMNRWCHALFSQFDLLLTPTAPCDPPLAAGPLPTEIHGLPVPEENIAAFTIPFNWSWHPAISLPIGLSRSGLPIGLQIVGPRNREDRILQTAFQLESSCTDWSGWSVAKKLPAPS